MKNILISVFLIALVFIAGYFLINRDVNFPESETFDLVGVWQSDDDELFSREFMSNGTVIDRYITETLVETVGTWVYLNKEEIKEANLPETGNIDVIKIEFEDMSEPFFFSVVPQENGELSMAYLNGNGILNFKRGSVTPAPRLEIQVTSPEDGGLIESPLKLSGEARGTWFFEGDFPVVLTDWDGKIIAEGYVTAKGDWMTKDYVAFEGELEFETPEYGDTGTLIFQKDNPSDLPEHDAAFDMPVRFR